MGTCICCGAEIKDGLSLCRECYDLANNCPCRHCTAETGRHAACSGACSRYDKWHKCFAAVQKLHKELRAKHPSLPYKKGVRR